MSRKWYARLHPASRAQTCIKFTPRPRGAYARAFLRGKAGAKNPRQCKPGQRAGRLCIDLIFILVACYKNGVNAKTWLFALTPKSGTKSGTKKENPLIIS